MARPRVLADVAPLRRSPDFRRLFAGQLASFLGSQLTVVAVPFQVYRLTHSSLAVGLASLASLGPLVVGSLLGGSVVDAIDRRRLLLATQVLLAATSVGLALNATATHPALWPLFLLPALAASVSGVDYPARAAVIPALVERPLLPAAYGLWQVHMQVGGVAGPALAGLLLSRLGAAAVYWIDTASFGVALVSVARMHRLPPEGGGRRPGLRSVLEGVRYLKGRRALTGTFAVDLNAMIFGMPRALFPALGTNAFHGGATAVGLLYAAPGGGALLGAVLTGWVGGVRRQGRAVLLAVGAWGLAIALFGLVPWLPLALALLAVAGAADMVSAVFRNTILQLAVPDSLRGRLSGMHIAVVAGGPRLGDFEAGGVAALAGARFSVVSGGLACVAGAIVLASLLPELTHYHRDTAAREPGSEVAGTLADTALDSAGGSGTDG